MNIVKKWGWKKFGLGILAGLMGIAGLVFKLWNFFTDLKSKKKVDKATEKLVKESHQDRVDVVEVVTREEGRVDAVVDTITHIQETTDPATEERLDAIDTEVSEMSRRRREEALKRHGRS